MFGPLMWRRSISRTSAPLDCWSWLGNRSVPVVRGPDGRCAARDVEEAAGGQQVQAHAKQREGIALAGGVNEGGAFCVGDGGHPGTEHLEAGTGDQDRR